MCMCAFESVQRAKDIAACSNCMHSVYITASDMRGRRALQLGDRPRLDQGLGNFQSFNEPFYHSYINDSLGAARLSLLGRSLRAAVHQATALVSTGHMPCL